MVAWRNYIDNHYGFQVNFSSCHENYYSAWSYTTKGERPEALQLVSDPDLQEIGEPSMSHASHAQQGNRQGDSNEPREKRQRRALTIIEVSHLAVKRNKDESGVDGTSE